MLDAKQLQRLLDTAIATGITEVSRFLECGNLHQGQHRLATDPQIEAIKQFLREDATVASVFDNQMFYTVSGGSRVSLDLLIQWLFIRVKEKDSRTAVANLEQYLESHEVLEQDVWTSQTFADTVKPVSTRRQTPPD